MKNRRAPQLPGPLVPSQWLADHLGNPSLAVLDASVIMTPTPGGPPRFESGRAAYLDDAHIPGALYADLIDAFSEPDAKYGFTRPDAARFAAAASALGIGNDTTIVTYDRSSSTWAARLWWMFRACGHDNAAVLDGGLRNWRAEKRPIETGPVSPRGSARFTAHERPELWATKSEVEGVVAGRTTATLVCALSHAVYCGSVRMCARAGHIPGSLSVPFSTLMSPVDGTYLDQDTLAGAFDAFPESGRIISYCGGGISAAADALALTLLGRKNVAIYDGSLNEWADDPAAPLTTL
jgi:thiosulfate/3-mercaptopyruvate sulfurtransferase